MEGLNGQQIKVLRIGLVLWDLEDVSGIHDTLETAAYFVPKANISLVDYFHHKILYTGAGPAEALQVPTTK